MWYRYRINVEVGSGSSVCMHYSRGCWEILFACMLVITCAVNFVCLFAVSSAAARVCNDNSTALFDLFGVSFVSLLSWGSS